MLTRLRLGQPFILGLTPLLAGWGACTDTEQPDRNGFDDPCTQPGSTVQRPKATPLVPPSEPVARGGRTFGLSGLPADKEASLPEEEEGNRWEDFASSGEEPLPE